MINIMKINLLSQRLTSKETIYFYNHINISLNYNMQTKKSSKYLNVYKKIAHE